MAGVVTYESGDLTVIVKVLFEHGVPLNTVVLEFRGVWMGGSDPANIVKNAFADSIRLNPWKIWIDAERLYGTQEALACLTHASEFLRTLGLGGMLAPPKIFSWQKGQMGPSQASVVTSPPPIRKRNFLAWAENRWVRLVSFASLVVFGLTYVIEHLPPPAHTAVAYPTMAIAQEISHVPGIGKVGDIVFRNTDGRTLILVELLFAPNTTSTQHRDAIQRVREVIRTSLPGVDVSVDVFSQSAGDPS